MEQEQLCNEVETVRLFTYFADSVSVGGGCETAVTTSHFQSHLVNVVSY